MPKESIKKKFVETVEEPISNDEKRAKIVESIHEEAFMDVGFLSQLIISAVIATCGLLTNNNAVIIGAMIIAPLTWPIINVGMAVAKGNMNRFIHSFGILFLSVALSLVTVLIVSIFIPFQNVTPEILSRVSPTFTDLIIALAAGVIAALATVSEKVSNSIAGVAVAASLLPPLCVIGIGFIMRDYDITYGSTLLFTANLLAMMLVSSFVFSILGFHPRRRSETEKRGMYIGYAISISLFALFLFPLSYFVQQSFQNEMIKNESKQILSHQLKKISEESSVRFVNIQNLGEYIRIEADVLFPEKKAPRYKLERMIDQVFEEKWNKSVFLTLNVIPIVGEEE